MFLDGLSVYINYIPYVEFLLSYYSMCGQISAIFFFNMINRTTLRIIATNIAATSTHPAEISNGFKNPRLMSPPWYLVLTITEFASFSYFGSLLSEDS